MVLDSDEPEDAALEEARNRDAIRAPSRGLPEGCGIQEEEAVTSWTARVTFETGNTKRHRIPLGPFTVRASSLEAAMGKAARTAMSRWREEKPGKAVLSLRMTVERVTGREA